MKQEVKKLWVDALRSGEYKQATGALHYIEEDGKTGFCCLGVLCDVAVKSGVQIEVDKSDSIGDGVKYDGKSGALPKSVRDWAGLDDMDPTVTNALTGDEAVDYNGYRTSTSAQLSELNDTFNRDFNQIADLIEKEL